MKSGQTRPAGSSWSVLASPLQGKGPVPALPSGAVSPGRDTEKGTKAERGQMTYATPHGESGKTRLRSQVPNSFPYFPPRLPVACFGIGLGGAGLGGPLGGPGVLAHFLPGFSCCLWQGTISDAWYAWPAAASLLGWGLYLWL